MKNIKNTTEAFRIVIRGMVAGKYVRRVRVVNGTFDDTMKFANDNANDLFKGMKTPFFGVLPGKKGGAASAE